MDNSRDLGQKCKHRLMHCMMCMHDESPLLACKTNTRDPDLTWSPPHDQGQGAAISHIIRQADDVLPCLPQGGWQRGHTHTHTHTQTHMHMYAHRSTHIFEHMYTISLLCTT